MIRFILALMICVTGFFYTETCVAQDTRPHLSGQAIIFQGPMGEDGLPAIVIKDLGELPHDYAQYLPPEVYYWWAIKHNERAIRQAERTPSSSPGVLQIHNNRNPYVPQGRGYYGGYRGNGTTTIRYYERPSGSGPVTLYNPYFRYRTPKSRPQVGGHPNR